MRARPRVEVLWCPNRRRGGHHKHNDGWRFPRAVRALLLDVCNGRSVLQLFGGKADFGLRLDIDPVTRPHVIGDAWLPPFGKNSFDVVILDPPYLRFNQQEKNALLRAAGWVARQHVIWFHTMWIASDRGLQLERSWLVRVGDTCNVRCIQMFRATEHKRPPVRYFQRGPAMRYNRWLLQPELLPFGIPE